MRRMFLSFVLAFTGVAMASAQGIKFETGTIAEIMAKAKAENKVVFVDVYTDWCGPCKAMANGVFLKESVGEVFNKNFINYKIDAEKGEGPEFAKKYGVTGYPTMFFINPQDGSVIHRIVGARGEEAFLDEAKMMEKSAKFGGLEKMKTDFENGANDPKFLLDFYNLLAEKDKMRGLVALRYLNSIPDEVLFDMNSDDTAILLGDMIEIIPAYDKEFFHRFMNGMKDLKESGGKLSSGYNLAVVFSVEQKLSKFMEEAIGKGDKEALEEYIQLKSMYPEGLSKNLDDDVELIYGRGIYFASSDFLRMMFICANEKEAEFREDFPAYMDELMARYPQDSLGSGSSEMNYMVNVVKSNPQYMSMFGNNFFGEGKRSIDMFTRFITYYWNISPNSKSVKSQVARWVEYIAAINPYNAEGIAKLMPLMVRVGHKKDALALVDNSMALMEDLGQKDSARYHLLENLRRNIVNDKI